MAVAALAAVSGMLAACSSSDSSSAPAATAAATAAETAGGVGDFGEDGGYAYATNVDDHRLLVVDVCEVKAALDAEGGPEYADINSVYTDGANWLRETDRSEPLRVSPVLKARSTIQMSTTEAPVRLMHL